jgi:hypothetical protein
MIREPITLPRRILLIVVIVLLIANCLLLVIGSRCSPKERDGRWWESAGVLEEL